MHIILHVYLHLVGIPIHKLVLLYVLAYCLQMVVVSVNCDMVKKSFHRDLKKSLVFKVFNLTLVQIL